MGKWDKGKMSLSEVRFLFSLDESGVVGPQRKKREKEVWVPIFFTLEETPPSSLNYTSFITGHPIEQFFLSF